MTIYSMLRQKPITVLILILVILVSVKAIASDMKRIGLPLITNYPRSAYKAGTQNWGMTQNSRGYLYVANNDGLLEFDGQHWELFPVPNKTIVRSVLAVGDTIYVGAFEEFGYFSPDQSGKLAYTSLIQLTDSKHHACDEIWKIHQSKSGIIFQSFKYIFTFSGGQISIIEPESSFGQSYKVNEQIYVADLTKGLCLIDDKQLIPVSSNPVFLTDELRCILPYEGNKLLIGFVNNGLYLLEGTSLRPWNTNLIDELIENSIFSGIRLQSGNFAFGSIQNGIYIANKEGKVLQHINRFKGLLNNTILSLYEDLTGNLWLGLDNGIDYLEINSPLSIFDYNYHIESTYASVVFDDKLYVGTNQGLFVADLIQLDNTRTEQADFSLIPGTEGQVWNLTVVEDQLLCGHNFGCFMVKGSTAIKIDDERGYWMFVRHAGNSDTLIAGTYNGLAVLTKSANRWKKAWKIANFEESSRSIVQDHELSLWIAHGYRGIFKVDLSADLKTANEVWLYDKQHGLPDALPYNVHIINRELVFTSKEGFYEYKKDADTFIPSAKFNSIFDGNKSVDNLYTDQLGNVWYFAFGKMGLMRLLVDGKYTNISAPFNRINPLLIESYENVFAFDNRNVFIGSQKGLLHYDPHFKKDYNKHESVFLREVIFSSANNKLILGEPDFKKPQDIQHKAVSVPYDLNSVSFKFANPSFEASGNITFSYRLVGFEHNWSLWDKSTYKEYTNLSEGSYTFELKVNILNVPDEKVYAYSFDIDPPFYRSGWAYLFYALILILILLGNLFFIRKRIRNIRLREIEKHEKALLEKETVFKEKALIAEKEIIHLRNESLQNEIEHKNKELANTTLHLIHKNKILNNIKYQLNDLMDKSLPQTKRNEIEFVISKINKELKNEKFQELFEGYFDGVHQDFIIRLKEKHPDLSPKELRLCAYLKMNLSTKEIAPLMNISIRGVEIGRYRLRKKLDLEREENLISYLINF
ncbi:MAG: triple tyrosine motif-containing protein [Bacteroidales bacterium]|nr:triple tyrosine motif-containing protein [Bacteroidales bacterium]